MTKQEELVILVLGFLIGVVVGLNILAQAVTIS